MKGKFIFSKNYDIIQEPGLAQLPKDSIDFLKELTVFSIDR